MKNRIALIILMFANSCVPSFAKSVPLKSVYEQNMIYFSKYLKSQQNLINITKDKKTKQVLQNEIEYKKYIIEQAKIPLIYELMKLDRKHAGDGLCMQDVNNFKECDKIEINYITNGCTIKNCIETFLSIIDEQDKYFIRQFPASKISHRRALIGNTYIMSLNIFANADSIVKRLNDKYYKGELSGKQNNIRLSMLSILEFKKILKTSYNSKTGFDNIKQKQKNLLINSLYHAHPYHKNQDEFKRKATSNKRSGGWRNRDDLTINEFFSNS